MTSVLWTKVELPFQTVNLIMFALHTKKEAAHNDGIWCCDWRQVKDEEEDTVEEIIVTGGVDDVVKIWNYKEGELELKHQLTEHSLGVVSVALSSDGRKVASSSLDSVIIVWDTNTGAKIATMDTGPVDAWSVIFTSDDQFVVSGTHSGAVNLFNVETGGRIAQLLFVIPQPQHSF